MSMSGVKDAGRKRNLADVNIKRQKMAKFKKQRTRSMAEDAFDRSMGYIPSDIAPRDPIVAAFLSVENAADGAAFVSAFKDYGELANTSMDGDNTGLQGLKIKQEFTNNLFPRGKRMFKVLKEATKIDPFKPSVELGFKAMGADVAITKDFRSDQASARVNKGNFELSSSTDPYREGGQTQLRYQKRF